MVESGRRVLVVEDDPAILDLIVTRLEIAGFQTFTARDGYDALAQVGSVRPGAMVLDIGLPRLDGFSVLLRLATIKPRPAVLVLTARHAAGDVKEALRLGARDYLTKPFDDAQLLMRVNRLFRTAPTPARTPPETDQTNSFMV